MLLPVVFTGCIYGLMRSEHRQHRGTVGLTLFPPAVAGAPSVHILSVERGLALLLAIAVLERWWLARTIALALGAMLLALEVRAVHEKPERKLRREAAASCEAEGGVLVVSATANEFVCLMRRAR